MVAQIQKNQKTRCIFFEFCFWEDPLHPVNWSLTHSTGPQTLFFADISVMVTQIKKIKKTRCIFYRIMLLGGPSPPSQLVPNPLNWSPNTVFCKYLSNGHSNKKKFQIQSASFNKVHFLSKALDLPVILRCVGARSFFSLGSYGHLNKKCRFGSIKCTFEPQFHETSVLELNRGDF